MKRLCICDICSCGRHRCPAQPTGLYSKGSLANMVTEYVEKYPGYEGHPPNSFKPKCEFEGFKGKMESTTTVKEDYVPYEVGPRPERKVIPYVPQPGKVDGDTTYKLHYMPHRLEREGPMLPKSRPIATGKVDSVSTYKDNYRRWEQGRRELLKPDLSYHPPNVRFGNPTTTQEDYVLRKRIPQYSCKPPHGPKLSDAPFNGITTNNLCYMPHDVKQRYFKPPDVYKPSGQPFQDCTSYRHFHRGMEGAKASSCKPEHRKVGSDAPLSSSTEFLDKYKEWPIPLPFVRKVEPYRRPTAKMQGTTTTHNTYVKYSSQPPKPLKPPSNLGVSSARFYDRTTTKEDYRLWDGKRRYPLQRTDQIPRATGKMEHMTTFRDHYVQQPMQPLISCRPPARPVRTDALMNSNTTYLTEYTPKKVKLCPARFEYPLGYVFEEVNERGHRLFRKVFVGEGNNKVYA